MKKMISVLAVLAMLTAVPVTTAFAADAVPESSSVLSEEIQDKTDIRNIVGQWRYQLAADGKTVDISAKDNGIITVKEDGTYTYTDLDGKVSEGRVKLEYDTMAGDQNVPFFAFYEGDKFFIGCYCNQNNPNTYLIGNGGMSQLLSVDADFSAIEGKWEVVDIDARVFEITASGVYIVTYPDNSSEQGFITIGNKPFGDSENKTWYNFYNESGHAWISFQKNEKPVVNELTEGVFTLRRMNDPNEDPRNEYGFYTPKEYPASGLSTASLIDTWKDAENDKAVLTITEGRTLYNSKFEYTDGNETIRGIINLEYILKPDGNKEYWYTFYNIDGSFWKGFIASGEIPLNDIYSGQDGATHFVREEKQDEKSADKEQIAVSRMKDLNTILAVMNASPMYTTAEDEYAKVTDTRFTSVDGFKKFISETCTEELKDELLGDCNNSFKEKDGSLYVKRTYRSFYQFRTGQGVTINDPDMNFFSATTNQNDELYGYGTAVFFFDNGKWRIKSYSFGSAPEKRLFGGYVSVPSGSLALRSEADSASTKLADIPDGTQVSVFESETTGWYKVEYNGITGYVTADNIKEIPDDYDPTETTQPATEYTAEELRDMAIKDYEKRTGIHPASAEVFDNTHGVVTVVLKDEAGNILDTYTLDPATGSGINSINETVELPQTGYSAMKTVGAVAAAMALVLAGTAAVTRSYVIRRKENE